MNKVTKVHEYVGLLLNCDIITVLQFLLMQK
jgi:hypothetical protein